VRQPLTDESLQTGVGEDNGECAVGGDRRHRLPFVDVLPSRRLGRPMDSKKCSSQTLEAPCQAVTAAAKRACSGRDLVKPPHLAMLRAVRQLGRSSPTCSGTVDPGDGGPTLKAGSCQVSLPLPRGRGLAAAAAVWSCRCRGGAVLPLPRRCGLAAAAAVRSCRCRGVKRLLSPPVPGTSHQAAPAARSTRE
jgi:hypothetical protein